VGWPDADAGLLRHIWQWLRKGGRGRGDRFRTKLLLNALNTAFLPPMRAIHWNTEWASPSVERGRQIGEILRQQTADLICISRSWTVELKKSRPRSVWMRWIGNGISSMTLSIKRTVLAAVRRSYRVSTR